MKVKELAKMLENADPEEEVMIALEWENGGIGAIPKTEARFAYSGFDWDRGSFLIVPREKLGKGVCATCMTREAVKGSRKGE